MKAQVKKGNPIWFGIAGLAVVGIGFGVYWMFFRESDTKEVPPAMMGGPRPTTKPCRDTAYPIRRGRCGEYVKPLQRHLNSFIKPPLKILKVDGDFGPKTEAAAKQYLGRTEFSQSSMLTIF